MGVQLWSTTLGVQLFGGYNSGSTTLWVLQLREYNLLGVTTLGVQLFGGYNSGSTTLGEKVWSTSLEYKSGVQVWSTSLE